MLSQLSYSPENSVSSEQMTVNNCSLLTVSYSLNLVGLGGFEPPTSPLSGVRSNQLSYRPGKHIRFVVRQTVIDEIALQLAL